MCLATKCECGLRVDYTNHAIRDVLLNGISDPDIRREVLGTKDILLTPVNDVISLVEGKEMARNALPTSSLSAICYLLCRTTSRHSTGLKNQPHLERRDPKKHNTQLKYHPSTLHGHSTMVARHQALQVMRPARALNVKLLHHVHLNYPSLAHQRTTDR
jgi:hypothetical protein